MNYKIKDISTIINGATPSTANPLFWNGNISWLTPKDLTDYAFRVIFEGHTSITKEGYESCSTKLVPQNTLLLSSRAPIGYLAIAGKEMCTNQGFKAIVCNSKIVNYLYLYYWFLTKTEYLQQISSGSTFKELSKETLENVEINLPSLNQQQHIVNTIGSIDDLIENNCKFLESFQTFLKNLYKEFSYNLKISKRLSELVIRTGRLLKNKEWIESSVMDLSTMMNDNIFINKFSPGKEFTTNIKTVDNFDLVYGSIRPYFKKAGFALEINYIAGSVYSFKPIDNNFFYWLLACICSDDFHDFTYINSQGTKMPIINWETFCSYKCPYDFSVILTFNSIVEPLFKKCVLKMKQNRNLFKIKQLLLAKYF